MSLAADVRLPRLVIQFCAKCKFNLRAAYYAQELLSTFSTDLGEVSLVPVSGGIFIITLYHSTDKEGTAIETTVLWNKKVDGGFPETKELKDRVRNIVDPGRDLGHTDRALRKEREALNVQHTPNEQLNNNKTGIMSVAATSSCETCVECEEAAEKP